MGRPRRTAPGGLVYHVLNRANARQPIFKKDEDYRAFERVLAAVQGRVGMRLLAYCLMPNHYFALGGARGGNAGVALELQIWFLTPLLPTRQLL